jgi:hypothetical protein
MTVEYSELKSSCLVAAAPVALSTKVDVFLLGRRHAAQNGLDHLRVVFYDLEEQSGARIRGVAPLLPISNRIDIEQESIGKFGLCKTEDFPDVTRVNRRHFDSTRVDTQFSQLMNRPIDIGACEFKGDGFSLCEPVDCLVCLSQRNAAGHQQAGEIYRTTDRINPPQMNPCGGESGTRAGFGLASPLSFERLLE